MSSPTIIGSASAVKRYHQLKNIPHEKMQKMLRESRAATVRLLEERVQAEKQQITEREHRLGPVYRELASAMRKSPELKGVVQAIDSIERRHKPSKPLASAKSGFAARIPGFAPRITMVRQGSIHIVESPPFWANTGTWQEGDSNDFVMGPYADGASGSMGFEMWPGQSSSGHMSCWATVGSSIALSTNRPCTVQFTATPSYYWSYLEDSTWWRQAAGNMWISQQISCFNWDGELVDVPLINQVSLASFDDRNMDGFGSQNSGGSEGFLSNSPVGVLTTIPLVSFIALGSKVGAFLSYQCAIGGSCNADGSDGQSQCEILLTATCPNLIIDMFEF